MASGAFAYNPAMPDATPDFLLAAALDALLDKQPTAKTRLQRHVGKCVRLVLPLIPLSLRIEADGGFVAASSDATPDVQLIPDPSTLPQWLTGGKFGDLFRVAGDGVLAADLAGALADFDWVLALRPYFGDIAASRIDQLLQGVMNWRGQALESAGRNLAEYAVYEQDLLAEPEAVREFIAEVDRLREDADRLEARLSLLESARKA
jgi:ubiquinone biosynthesis protein UbiJ